MYIKGLAQTQAGTDAHRHTHIDTRTHTHINTNAHLVAA